MSHSLFVFTRKSGERQWLQFDSVLRYPLLHHPFWHETEERFRDGVEHALTDVVVADVERDTALRQVIALYAANVLTLLVSEKRQVHLGDDGEAAILIDDADEGLYTPCLIDMPPFGPGLAKTESTISKALRLLHHPHLLVLQVLGLEDGKLPPAVLCKIDHELLRVKRYLQHALPYVSADGDASIEMAEQQFAEHHVGLHFLDT